MDTRNNIIPFPMPQSQAQRIADRMIEEKDYTDIPALAKSVQEQINEFDWSRE